MKPTSRRPPTRNTEVSHAPPSSHRLVPRTRAPRGLTRSSGPGNGVALTALDDSPVGQKTSHGPTTVFQAETYPAGDPLADAAGPRRAGITVSAASGWCRTLIRSGGGWVTTARPSRRPGGGAPTGGDGV